MQNSGENMFDRNTEVWRGCADCRIKEHRQRTGPFPERGRGRAILLRSPAQLRCGTCRVLDIVTISPISGL